MMLVTESTIVKRKKWLLEVYILMRCSNNDRYELHNADVYTIDTGNNFGIQE